jgi:hypothetical protein
VGLLKDQKIKIEATFQVLAFLETPSQDKAANFEKKLGEATEKLAHFPFPTR